MSKISLKDNPYPYIFYRKRKIVAEAKVLDYQRESAILKTKFYS